MPLVVAYWEIRGLAAPMRMMCEYAGAEYEVKHYTEGSYQDWFEKDKPDIKKKNAFANLPYILDGDMTVCQTNACMTYLARKFGLYGATPEESQKVDQVLCQVYDLRNDAVNVFYGSGDFDGHMKGSVPTNYGKFEEWVENCGSLYTVGNTPTAGDFHLWEMLDQHEKLAKDKGFSSPLEGKPRLTALHKALREEPKLARYFAGPLATLQVNGSSAHWK